MITALHSNSYMRSRVTHTRSICSTFAIAHSSVRLRVQSGDTIRLLPFITVSSRFPAPPSSSHPPFGCAVPNAVLKRQLIVPQKLTHSVFNSGSFFDESS